MVLPSLDTLRGFVAAARLLNFTQAARSVTLTPAAFGQRIKQLEDQLGVALFARTTRSVRLTEAGIALLPFAEQCLRAAQEGARAARGENGPTPMELTLGTRHELGVSWLLPQLAPLASERPWQRLHLYFGSGPDLLLRVRTLEIDAAITSTRFNDPKLDAIRLHTERYAFVGAAKLLRRMKLRRDADAAAHTLLDASADLPLFRYWRDARGGGDRLRFGGYTYLGSIAAIHRRVREEAGVAVLPEYLVRKDLAAGRLVAVLSGVSPLDDYFRLVFRRDDPRRSVFESMATSLLKVPLR